MYKTVAATVWNSVNQVGHLSKTHLNLFEMCEISFVDASINVYRLELL